MKQIFEKIYNLHHWYDEETKSGPGASLKQTKTVRAIVSNVIKQFDVKTLLDIPCGDFNWMKEVDLSTCDYTGADIVQSLVEENSLVFSNTNKRFLCADLTCSQLPKVDLIFCRDCLVHFSYTDCWNAVENVKKSGSKFLLTTTFPGRKNKDIATGEWRPLNLQDGPFSFPTPVLLFNENCTEGDGRYDDKSLALWKVDDLYNHGL